MFFIIFLSLLLQTLRYIFLHVCHESIIQHPAFYVSYYISCIGNKAQQNVVISFCYKAVKGSLFCPLTYAPYPQIIVDFYCDDRLTL
jgi:hypothetical protein